MLNEREEIQVKEDVVLREEDDGAFLFDPGNGRICYLNEIGAAIWKLCKKPIKQEQIIKELCLEYEEVQEEKISKDCLEFLENLHQLGFLAKGIDD